MRCPHCLQHFHAQWFGGSIISEAEANWNARGTKCPNCSKVIISLVRSDKIGVAMSSIIVYPKTVARPVPLEVSPEYAEDFVEACLVLTDSPKASAALSRRCLQNLLRGVARVKHGDLYVEIGEVLESGQLPSHLAEAIDAVRVVGNFAAHPMKSTSTGTIVPVEPGEAEWLLDVLEGLFDFYFVQPAVLQRKKDALNKKLEDLGKSAIR